MATTPAQQELAHFLASPTRVATIRRQGDDVCSTVVVTASAASRLALAKTFRSGAPILGGSMTSGGDDIEWQGARGHYAVMRLRYFGYEGWLITSLREQSSCAACNLPPSNR